MVKIYHVPGTRSVRPIWLCHELNIDVEIETIDFSSKYRDSAAWRALSPAGKVPILTDGDLTMFESGAMVAYLLDRYGAGRLRPPSGTVERALYDQWCWFSEATLLRPLGLNRLLRQADDDLTMTAKSKVLEALAAVEQVLDGRDYLLAEGFCAADVMMGYSLILLDRFGLLSAEYPNAQAYFARLSERPALQRALRE